MRPAGNPRCERPVKWLGDPRWNPHGWWRWLSPSLAEDVDLKSAKKSERMKVRANLRKYAGDER